MDAIYLALPHGLHREWAVKALAAGKAVLCEKPAVLHQEEMAQIARTAREHGTLFMEAMKTRFVPAYPKIREVLASGEIGTITGMTASICNNSLDHIPAGCYLIDPEQGGILWDCGIYAVSWAEDFGKGNFRVTETETRFLYGVDSYVRARLEFENIPVTVEAAFDEKKPRETVFYGTKGELHVHEQHRSQGFTVLPRGGKPYTVERAYGGDYCSGRIRHFAACLKEGRTESPVMPLEASLRCAEIIDRIREQFPQKEKCKGFRLDNKKQRRENSWRCDFFKWEND